MSIQSWLPLRLTVWSLCCSRDSQESSAAPQFESINPLVLFMVQLSQPHVTTGNTIILTIQTFVGRVMSLLFNTLSRIVIAFLPRSDRILILWMQSQSAVIFEPKKRKSFCGKLLKRWEYQTNLPVSLETCLRVKKQQLERCVEQSGSGLRECDKVTTELSSLSWSTQSKALV